MKNIAIIGHGYVGKAVDYGFNTNEVNKILFWWFYGVKMNSKVADTSKDYDDMVGYKAEENLPTDLSSFLGEDSNQDPQIRPKPVDPEFPEPWQSIFVNFHSKDDYIKFMHLLGEVSGPTTNQLTFQTETATGILDFLNDWNW